MKLELKHISLYLPYGLDGFLENKIVDLNTNNIWTFTLNAKPILRPLSDLSEDDLEGAEYIVDKGLSADLNYYQWEYLFENHFDVFNLIENGLAIDKNTLES